VTAAGVSAVTALAEPTEPVPTRWTVAVSVASAGLYVGWFGPIQVLLGRQAEHLAPNHKEAALGVVVGIGAAFSVVSNPVFGALSDRTVSRFGRRLPWVLIGAVGGVLSLVLLAVAPNIAVMIIAWCLVQITLNASLAALIAAVPDQVPHRQRGLVGGWLGVAQTMGVVAGSALAAAIGGLTGAYLACAVVVAITAVPYLLLRKDNVLDRALRPAWDLRAFLRGFWINPRLHPDFGWGWLTRFLVNMGNAVQLVYLLYFLQDKVHLKDPDSGVFVLTASYAATLLITVVIGGIASDRSGRRRIFVLVSGIVLTVAALILASFPTWTGAVIAAVVLGLGFGVYTSVDFALLTEVLPAAVDRGKDLGMINIASSLPQAIAPALAAPIVTHLGGYPVLYLVSAGFALSGAVLVYRIRSVR
jgi:MFS family permease